MNKVDNCIMNKCLNNLLASYVVTKNTKKQMVLSTSARTKKQRYGIRYLINR